MSFLGTIKAGSVFATAQSAAAGGYGASMAAGAAQGGAVASSLALACLQWKRREGAKL
jgi:hypothetical protein